MGAKASAEALVQALRSGEFVDPERLGLALHELRSEKMLGLLSSADADALMREFTAAFLQKRGRGSPPRKNRFDQLRLRSYRESAHEVLRLSKGARTRDPSSPHSQRAPRIVGCERQGHSCAWASAFSDCSTTTAYRGRRPTSIRSSASPAGTRGSNPLPSRVSTKRAANSPELAPRFPAISLAVPDPRTYSCANARKGRGTGIGSISKDISRRPGRHGSGGSAGHPDAAVVSGRFGRAASTSSLPPGACGWKDETQLGIAAVSCEGAAAAIFEFVRSELFGRVLCRRGSLRAAHALRAGGARRRLAAGLGRDAGGVVAPFQHRRSRGSGRNGCGTRRSTPGFRSQTSSRAFSWRSEAEQERRLPRREPSHEGHLVRDWRPRTGEVRGSRARRGATSRSSGTSFWPAASTSRRRIDTRRSSSSTRTPAAIRWTCRRKICRARNRRRTVMPKNRLDLKPGKRRIKKTRILKPPKSRKSTRPSARSATTGRKGVKYEH